MVGCVSENCNTEKNRVEWSKQQHKLNHRVWPFGILPPSCESSVKQFWATSTESLVTTPRQRATEHRSRDSQCATDHPRPHAHPLAYYRPRQPPHTYRTPYYTFIYVCYIPQMMRSQHLITRLSNVY